MTKSCGLLGLLLLLAISLSGCVTEGTVFSSSLTGTVLDTNFNPVRGATVTAGGQTTFTSNTGAYQFTGLPDGVIEVMATINSNGVNYRGRTSVVNSPNIQNSSANIVVGPVTQLGTIRGTVRDRDGFVLQGASVFAYMGSGGSQRALTNANGVFELRDIVANFNYDVSASGQGYSSDQTTINLAAGEIRTIDFVLDDPNIVGLNPPQNVGAVTWVSHPDSSRGPDGSALNWAQDHFKKGDNAFRPRTRSIRSDMIVETELFWDQQINPNLFGFGVYRSNSLGGVLNGIDFYFDPLAPYYVDGGLEPFSFYEYGLTTIETLYPDFPNQTESQLSNIVTAETLNLLTLQDHLINPIEFRWLAGSGATEYIVYVFDRYPDIGVTDIWNTENSPTTNFSQVYTGPPLQAGRTYFYLVLGIKNGFDSRTISQVDTFIP